MERSGQESDELRDWPDRLEQAVRGTRFEVDLVRVLAACDSTQDLARDLGIGSVVTTGTQRRGRGRLGRSWSDDEGSGIAVSLGLRSTSPDVACMAAAVASRKAVQGALVARGLQDEADRVGLKFPNDLVDVASARKLGGILVEVVDELAVVGIGINVGLRTWPEDVPGMSLGELGSRGSEIGRIDVLERLPLELDRLWSTDPEEVRREFMKAHAPTGRHVRVEQSVAGGGPRVVEGRLIEFDPCRLLRVATSAGPREIPTSGARILSWRPDSADQDRAST